MLAMNYITMLSVADPEHFGHHDLVLVQKNCHFVDAKLSYAFVNSSYLH
jgi:hypothetical protein